MRVRVRVRVRVRTWLSAWFECVMMSVRCCGKVWWMLEIICTAVSVLPVPGGPTTTVSPGFIAARSASTWLGLGSGLGSNLTLTQP